jgi:hypothetical protein
VLQRHRMSFIVSVSLPFCKYLKPRHIISQLQPWRRLGEGGLGGMSEAKARGGAHKS